MEAKSGDSGACCWLKRSGDIAISGEGEAGEPGGLQLSSILVVSGVMLGRWSVCEIAGIV